MSAWWLVPIFAIAAGLALLALGRALYPHPINWDVEPDRSSPEDRARRSQV